MTTPGGNKDAHHVLLPSGGSVRTGESSYLISSLLLVVLALHVLKLPREPLHLVLVLIHLDKFARPRS